MKNKEELSKKEDLVVQINQITEKLEGFEGLKNIKLSELEKRGRGIIKEYINNMKKEGFEEKRKILQEKFRKLQCDEEIYRLEEKRRGLIFEYIKELGGYPLELGNTSVDVAPLGTEGMIKVENEEKANKMVEELLKVDYCPEICFNPIKVINECKFNTDNSKYLAITYHSCMPILYHWESVLAYDCEVLDYARNEETQERIEEGLRELGFEEMIKE
jgi:hypothetical protein